MTASGVGMLCWVNWGDVTLFCLSKKKKNAYVLHDTFFVYLKKSTQLLSMKKLRVIQLAMI